MLEGILSGLAFSGFFSIRLMPCMTLPIMTTRFVASFYDYYYSYFFNSNYLFWLPFLFFLLLVTSKSAAFSLAKS